MLGSLRLSLFSAAIGLSVIACSSSPSEDATDGATAEINAAAQCNPLPLRVGPVPAIDGLIAMGDAPLPSAGPDAEGYFHPAPGYTEGGTFERSADEDRWKVNERDVAERAPAGKLRVAEWNVERGNKLDKSVRLMKKINADVWLINESDLYGKNSGGVVVAREIARALGYSYYTGIEFFERRDDRRGTSGNAIVSRYPLRATRAVEIPIMAEQGGHDWSTDSAEPRCGQRGALTALIDVPTASGEKKEIRLVALHTENKANAKVRLAQFDHIVGELVKPNEPAVVAGDLNTVSPGEGSSFRRELAKRAQQNGEASSLFDCSRGDDRTTFSAAVIVQLRIDWMLVQSGSDRTVECPASSYNVVGNDGASDHKPVITEMTVR